MGDLNTAKYVVVGKFGHYDIYVEFCEDELSAKFIYNRMMNAGRTPALWSEIKDYQLPPDHDKYIVWNKDNIHEVYF